MNNSVLQVTRPLPEVALLKIEDREAKNCFTDTLMHGLVDTFRQVSKDTSVHAVVMTGYDSYFCSGATRKILERLQAGKADFSEGGLYNLPLDCEVPVIAAMQGHAIGGGLVFGLFSDVVVLSRESVYAANFMKYGFTPGMGATLVLPLKLGTALGTEMLISARTYRGQELADRGVPYQVLPRADVLDHAMGLARDLARIPRTSLTLLKAHLNRALHASLPDTIERELAMHQATIGNDDVRARIASLFDG